MNEEIKQHIREKLKLVPELPGSYQMKNKDGIIIYVGKAKNLKNRLKSYFTGLVTGKTAMLVADIVDFEYIVTSTELESLILEITLIKKYNPKSITYIGILASPEGLKNLELKHPDVNIYIASIDKKLNENGYIVPGLGDAGDRLFGTK